MKLFANAQYLTLGELSSELQFDLMKAIYITGNRNKTYFFSIKMQILQTWLSKFGYHGNVNIDVYVKIKRFPCR